MNPGQNPLSPGGPKDRALTFATLFTRLLPGPPRGGRVREVRRRGRYAFVAATLRRHRGGLNPPLQGGTCRESGSAARRSCRLRLLFSFDETPRRQKAVKAKEPVANLTNCCSRRADVKCSIQWRTNSSKSSAALGRLAKTGT